MEKSKFLLTLMAIVTLLSSTYAQKKPNILFIMSDDHTTQAIGAYGSRLAELNPSPTIDLLAKNGMLFTRVYCNNSICTPSRASIITGQYPQKNGVLDLEGNIPPERQYLPMEMKKAGYQTAMVGKWHLEKEPAGFDYYCVLPGQGKYHNPTFRIQGDRPWTENTIKKNDMHSSDAITDISLDWLRNKRDPEKPFFLMHHFKAPHDMFSYAERYGSYLADIKIPEPRNLFDAPAGSVATEGLGSGLGREHAPWKLGKRLGISDTLEEREYIKACYQEYLKRYLRCVKGVDDNLKRILDFLEETGELDNTIIIYTSDQGFLLGEHDLMDKRWMFEEAMRMPFIVHWPNQIKKGQTNNWLINNTDFAPTILELAGIPETPEYMQGHSFVAAIKGKKKPEDWRETTYYRYWMHMAHNLAVPAHFGVRNDRYKLIFFYGCDFKKRFKDSDWPDNGNKPDNDKRPPEYFTPPAWELYDLKNDPYEMNNLYGKPGYEKITARLKSQLRNLRSELDETDENYPHIQEIIDKYWEQ